MHDVSTFGGVILIAAIALSFGLLLARFSRRIGIPAAAPLLLAAAVASDLFPSLAISTRTVERIASLALIVILFDGGAAIGWRRFRESATPIVSLGILGTFATAGGIALVCHWALGFDWTLSGLVGAAIAPTDPAVMFSVFGDLEISGRTGTILEGESGANDPVGIAMMLGLIEVAQQPHAGVWVFVRTFAQQLGIGLAIGVAGGLVLAALMQRLSLPSAGLYTLRTLAGAGVIYGLTAVAHGSGFLAVFVAGLIVSDRAVPHKAEIEIFQEALSSLAEIAVFVVLGLTISLSAIGAERWGEGLLLALVLAVVIRPAVVGLLLLPARLDNGERAFIAWAGLKGAVPILLASFALERGVADSLVLYQLVFVVVLASVSLQGVTIPLAARRFGVRLKAVRSGG
jgi:potassium/hydrogen antiporter